MNYEDLGEVLRDMCVKMVNLLEEQRRMGKISEEVYSKQTALKKKFIEEYGIKEGVNYKID